MNTGSPPTPPKALAGLLTPPGMSRLAWEKASLLALRDTMELLQPLGRCTVNGQQ